MPKRVKIRSWLLVVGACALLGILAESLAAQAAPQELEKENATPPRIDQATPELDPAPAPGLPEMPSAQSGATEGGAPHQLRLREGTQLTDRLGRFRQDGDLLTFIDEEGHELGGLPNLGLERILRALKGIDEPESVWWSVSGTVTEFSDRNYLLVTRAIYKAATLPPSPESVE